MEKIIREQSGVSTFSKIIDLNLSGLNLMSIDTDVLEECVNLQSLDISKNQLKDLSHLKCIQLRSLNFEHNCVTNLKFLSQLPLLETLYIDGNPLSVADRYIAVDQLSNLQTLDAKPCNYYRSIINEFNKKLNAQGEALYENKYKEIVNACNEVEGINYCQKQYFRELLNKISPGCKVPPTFIRYKVQNFAENVFSCSNLVQELRDLKISCKRIKNSPVKKIVDSSKTVGTPRKVKLVSDNNCDELISPSKRRKCKNDKLFLEYEPQLILRTHSNDPQDCDTPIWCAAFEPDILDQRQNTDMVATCGGNTVCFLNYKTGHVLMKYKKELENFYALDWTVLAAGEKGKAKVTVLATGGINKTVHLIIPFWKTCYSSFKAHKDSIDTLHFHPDNETWLFTGGKDKNVHLWDIGTLKFPKLERTNQTKLMTFDAAAEVLRILFSPSYDSMFVATTNGLLSWTLKGDIATWTTHPSSILVVPDSCKSEESEVIDGMVFVSEKIMAVKICKSEKIFLWDVSTISSTRKIKRQKNVEISPIVIFLWSECYTDYIYIDCCQEFGLLACGDDTGRLWLYNVASYVKGNVAMTETDVQPPNVVFPWPKLVFDKEKLKVRSKIIVNSVKFTTNGDYLIACTDSNLLCIWKRI